MIVFNQVSKSFGTKKVLELVSFKIKKGTLTAVTGPSGCGKTTLLNIIGGLEKPDHGEVRIETIDNPYRNSASRLLLYRNQLSYLFQNYALIDHESIEYNLLIALRFVKHPNKKALMKEALAKVHLDVDLKAKVYTLSGGEQQRVAIARLFLKPGSIILADEPTGNLDHENGEEVIMMLKSLSLQGKTVVVVTHDSSYLSYFDDVIHLEGNDRNL